MVVMVVIQNAKNPISLPPSGFQSKAALAAFVERPQAAEFPPNQIGACF
jgi:hypothetical protein